MTTSYDELALRYSCLACGAKPGEWCRTYRPTRRSAGARASWLHSARTGPLYEATSMGYGWGEEAGMSATLEDPAGARAELARREEARKRKMEAV